MWRTVLLRLRALVHRAAVEEDLDQELRFHLERQTEAYIQAGMTPEEARRRARLEFGGLEQMKEHCRDVRGVALIETLLQDLRYAIRVLAKSPGFTAVAVLSLALGIGANTALFSLVSDVMLEPLPVRNPQELVQVVLVYPSGARVSNLDYPESRPLTEGGQSFSGMLVYTNREANFRSQGAAERIRAQLVSGSYYSTLGVNAFLGRTITAEDDQPSAVPVAVLSYAFWARKFSRDPSALGKAAYLDGSAFMIVGVTPPGFFGVDRLSAPDISVPLGTVPPPGYIYCLGRLRPGVSLEQARSELAVQLRQALEDWKEQLKNWPPGDRQAVLGLKVDLNRAGTGTWDLSLVLRDPLRVLLVLVGAILLIACMNVANLLLGRAAARSREISVRLALGAGRGRILRQLLTESVLLSGMGGFLGLLFALWVHHLLRSLLPIHPAAAVRFHLDGRILGFAAAASVLAGILCGLAPAWRATRAGVYPALKGERPGIAGRLRLGPARALLVFQVAASLVLLVGAMLFVRTLHNLQTLEAGFDREHVLLMTIDPQESRFKGERMRELPQELTERVGALPGVRSVSLAESALFGVGGQKTIWVEGYHYAPNENQFAVYNLVTPGFFATAGIPLLAGRDFSPQDRAGAPPVAIVNEAMARKYYPNQNPIGRRFGDQGPTSSGKHEIIGVAADANCWRLREGVRRTVFHPLGQLYWSRRLVLHVRTFGHPAAMTARVRQEVQSIDKDLTVYNVRTMTEHVNTTLRRERMFATLSTLFGALALGLACVGLYGVAAYSVARRTGEIGVRMALGAGRGDVLWLVLRQTLGLVVAGVVVGAPIALASTRFIKSLLFGLTPSDPVSVAAAIAVLAAVAALAGLLPARRAARVDPVVALRYE